jgi:hypothetical protein
LGWTNFRIPETERHARIFVLVVTRSDKCDLIGILLDESPGE